MRPWATRKKCVEIDRELLSGEWLEVGIGNCARCKEERRIYAPMRVLIATHLLSEFARLFMRRSLGDARRLHVCADCSRVYDCASHTDQIRYRGDEFPYTVAADAADCDDFMNEAA